MTTVGSVEWVGTIDGRRLLGDARKLGKQASQEFDKSFDKEFNAFHARLSGRFSKLGSELGTQMRRSGDLAGVSFTSAMERVVQRSLSGIADEVAEAFATPDGLKDFAAGFDDIDAAAAAMRKRLDELNEAGGLNDKMWRRLGGTLNQFVGEQRKVERAAADQRAEANLLAIELAELHEQFDDDKRRSVNGLAIELAGLNDQLGADRQKNVNGLAIELAGLNQQFDDDKRKNVNGLAIELADLSAEFERSQQRSGGLWAAMTRLGASFRGFRKDTDDATGSSKTFRDTWKSLPHGFRQFTFYTGLFAALGQSIAVLGAAAGAGLTTIAGGAVLAVAGLGAMVAVFKDFGGELSNLPAAVRPAAEAFQSLGGIFTDLQDRMQVAALAGTTGAWESLGVLIQTLTPAFEVLAASVGNVVNEIAGMLTSANGVAVLTALITSAGPVFEALAMAAANLGGAFGNIFVVAMPYIERFSTWLNELMVQFNTWTQSVEGNNAISEWMSNAFAVFSAIGPLLAATGDALNQLVTPETVAQFAGLLGTVTEFMPLLGQLLGVIGTLDVFGILAELLNTVFAALSPLMPALDTLAGILASTLTGALQVLTPILGQIITALAPLVEVFLQMASQVLPILVGALEILLAPLASIIDTVAGALLPVFQQLAPLIGSIAQMFATLLAAVMPLIASLVEALMPTFMTIIEIVLQLIEAFMPMIEAILPPLLELFVALSPLLMAIVDAFILLLEPILALLVPLGELIATVLPPLMELITLLVGMIVDAMVPAFNATISVISAVVTTISGILAPAINMITTVLKGVIDFIIGVFTGDWERAWQGIVGIFEGIWNGIKGVAAGVINGVIDLINGLTGAINEFSGAVGIPPIGKIGHVAFASGGIINRPTRALMGEAGSEAVVPLTRPLSQVEPSVRDLAAYARGQGSQGGTERTVVFEDGAIRVVSPSADPRMVANAVLDTVVANVV